MKKLFVWDYHGTLEKGNDEVVLAYTNMALEEMGYERRLTREENLKLYGILWYKYFEYLLPDESPRLGISPKSPGCCYNQKRAAGP